MFKFQWIALAIAVIMLIAVLAMPSVAFATSDTLDAPTIVTAEDESDERQGYGPLIILTGLGAVAAVGGYYWIRESWASKNNNNE